MANPYPKNRKARRPRVLVECQACGKGFMAKPASIETGHGKTCSRECGDKVRKPRIDKKPRKSHVCNWCGKVFINQTHTQTERQYCSNKCLGLSKRKNWREHHRRKDSVEHQRWGRAVILRDKACVRCGVRENLQAHHVRSFAKHPELRLDVGNGVALCPVCHHAQHPTHKLELYLIRGGRTVQRCVVCEGEYVPRKKTQRTCSPKCGVALRYGKHGD